MQQEIKMEMPSRIPYGLDWILIKVGSSYIIATIISIITLLLKQILF